MAHDLVASGLLLLLLVVALVVLGLAYRHRLAFRIGVRNVARSPRRTVILVVGLLIGTTIISGSLVVGDTIDSLAVHYTLLAVGNVDEAIGNQSVSGGYSFFPYSVYGSVQSATSGDASISGVTPEIVTRVSILDRTSDTPQPLLYLIGVNANQSSQLGSFVSDAGATVAGPAPGEVILDDLAASELNASAGDSVSLYGVTAQPLPMTVQAVVQDNDRGSFPQGGIGNYGSAFVDLSAAQQLEQAPGSINYLVVSNSGNEPQQLANTPEVSANLNSTLATIPAAQGLSVYQVLKDALGAEEGAGSSISTLFLVLGLFSIAAGALLIVGIFLLLAEERKGEMGTERAMGLRRRELVYAFLFEGSIYAAGSALAGTALGVGVGYGLTYAFSELLRTPGLTPSALLGSFTVLPDTLLTAYVAGFLLTLITVVFASYRASRLNIVRAIRDLPEPEPTRRATTLRALIGGLLFLLGALLFATTYQGTSAESYPILGGAMAIAGLGLVASKFAPARPVFTTVGVALLVFAGLEPLHQALLGDAHGGGIYGVFVEGIVLVTGGILVYAFNASALAAGLVRLAGGREQRVPVAKVGLSYPGRRPGRTTVSLAIFALVAFTLVAIAGVGSSLDASLTTLVQEDSGGYALIASSAVSAPQLPSLVQNNSTLRPYFSDVVPLENGPIQVSINGSTLAPYNDSLYAGPAGEGDYSNFYSTNQYTYSATEGGMSAAQVDQELQTDPRVAVVDQTYSPVVDNLAASTSSGHPTLDPGGVLAVTNPLNGNTSYFTVIGIMTQSVLSGVFVSPAAAGELGIHQQTLFLMGVASDKSASEAEQVAKAAFFPYGLIVVDLEGAIQKSISTTEGEIALLEIFVALGLVVGVAAMGIVALRAVTERRREIGMLRACGFTEGMIVRAFLLEYSFITFVGLGIGALLGLLIVWNLTHSPEGTSSGVSVFAMPWTSLAIILLVAYGLSMLAVADPSRAAARLSPAVAVRPSE